MPELETEPMGRDMAANTAATTRIGAQRPRASCRGINEIAMTETAMAKTPNAGVVNVSSPERANEYRPKVARLCIAKKTTAYPMSGRWMRSRLGTSGIRSVLTTSGLEAATSKSAKTPYLSKVSMERCGTCAPPASGNCRGHPDAPDAGIDERMGSDGDVVHDRRIHAEKRVGAHGDAAADGGAGRQMAIGRQLGPFADAGRGIEIAERGR